MTFLNRIFTIALVSLVSFASASADITVESTTHKTIGDVELEMAIFKPADLKPSDKRAAVVFFFGGGWNGGSIAQFKPFAEHLAQRGMVAFTPEYRIRSKHDVTPDICVQDAMAHQQTWCSKAPPGPSQLHVMH